MFSFQTVGYYLLFKTLAIRGSEFSPRCQCLKWSDSELRHNLFRTQAALADGFQKILFSFLLTLPKRIRIIEKPPPLFIFLKLSALLLQSFLNTSHLAHFSSRIVLAKHHALVSGTSLVNTLCDIRRLL